MGTNPGFINGQKPTASQWNSYFTVKADDIPFTGDAGSGGLQGLVPAPTAGDTAAGKFLFADGTWEVPPGGTVTIPDADLLGGAGDDFKVITLGNGVNFTGEGQQILESHVAQFWISNKTANYVIPASETGFQYNNASASGEVDLTLPIASIGLTYGFFVSAAQTLKVIAHSGDDISIAAAISGVTNVTSNVPGSYLWVVCHETGHWVTMSMIGTWSG